MSQATVGSVSGYVYGVATGTPTIIYTLPTGCFSSAMVTVNPSPASIGGTASVCQDDSVMLTESTSGGTWSTSDPSTATVDALGNVYGVSNGSCTIYYTVPTGCMASTNFVVNPLPGIIAGSLQSCIGLPDTLTDVTPGGSWSSSATTIATIGSGTGIVMGINSGNANITYMVPTGCISTSIYTVNPNPVVETITGGGTFCAGGAGTAVGLGSSDTGISYQLYNGSSLAGSAVTGTGSAISLGTYSVTGTYTAFATNTTTGCTDRMSGSAVITVNPLPNVYNVTGGGSFCISATDTGVHVDLSGSDTGVNYTLYMNGSSTGSPLSGTGAPLDFGLQTTPGSYSAIATNRITTCVKDMADTVNVTADSVYNPVVTITSSRPGIDYGQSDTFTAHVTDGGPSLSYQWYVNLTAIHGQTNSTFDYTNAFGKNDTVICVVLSRGCNNVLAVGYELVNIENVGVSQVKAENFDVELVPNPNNGTFTVKGSVGASSEEVTLAIYDMIGQKVYNNTVMATGGNINEQIQLSGSLSNGMYLLDVNAGNSNKVFHFVLKQ